jgi:hypothetical protein
MKGGTRLVALAAVAVGTPLALQAQTSGSESIGILGRAAADAVARVMRNVLAPIASAPVAGACETPLGGYEGFGRNTTGGAYKALYRVTNLNDSGTGSLRAALSQGNRCVVFDVGGTITLASNLLVRGANVTIDGLTAPAPGITLKGATLVMAGASGAGNVVVRGIRHRGAPAGADAIRVYQAANVVIDRVSVSGFGDGAVDVTENSRDVAIQWSILGDGTPTHNFPSLIKYETMRVSVHHNLYVNSSDRNPHCSRGDGASALTPDTVCDVRNNIVWNYGTKATEIRGYARGNVVNNYYYSAYNPTDYHTIYVREGGSAYVSGNYSANGLNINAMGNHATPHPAVVPVTTDAITAARQVLARAGARSARFGLDAHDQAYVDDIAPKIP